MLLAKSIPKCQARSLIDEMLNVVYIGHPSYHRRPGKFKGMRG